VLVQPYDLLIDAFGRIRENVHRAADGLSADDLAFRPEADANSIAWLVWHLTRLQDDHVADLAGTGQVWYDGDWPERIGFTGDLAETGYGHTSEQVAAIRPDGPAPLLGYHDEVAERTVSYLRGLAADDLDRVVDRSWDPPVTAGVRLVSVINDNMQHSGQARYVRGMLERLRD
jgi:uncharacterized damage-inducible protein DinB